MATGGENLTAAAEQGADAELAAPSGWTKKVNPTRPGKFEVIFGAPTGEEIKTKRALTQYLKAHPGGPAVSEFNWATCDAPRRSSRLSEKVKATESSEDERPAKRGRSSSKKGKNEKQDDAEDEDEKPAKRGRPSSSRKGKKGKQEEAPAESEDHVDAEEAKGTDVEMKDADSAQEKKEADSSQEEKIEAETAQEEKKDVPMVDAAEKTEEAEVKTDGLEHPMAADAAGKTEEAEGNTEVSEVPKGADAAEKTEEAEVNTEVPELPKGADAAEKTEEAEGIPEVSVLPSDVSAPVSEEGAGKPAESEVALLEGEKTENGLATESKKEEAASIINPATPPPAEINVDAPAAEVAKAAENSTDAPAVEAAKAAENSADDAAHKDDQVNPVNVDSNGKIQPGASTVKCT